VFGEIFGGLLTDGGGDHGNGTVEVGKDLFLGELARFVEFAVAIAHVAGAGDLRADVVIQIAGEMQEQVADAVAVGKRLAPKLVGGKGRDPLVKAGANFFVVSGERGSNEMAEFWQLGLDFLAAAARAAFWDFKPSIFEIQISTFGFQLARLARLRAAGEK
jgi:hypothetical protein